MMSALSAITARRPLGMSKRRLGAAIAISVVLVALDRPLYHALETPSVEDADWYHALRALGYLPLWIVAAALFYISDRSAARSTAIQIARRRPAHHRAGLVLLSPILAGLGSELAKLVCRRLRPEFGDGIYRFRAPWVEPLSTSGLGLPSGHTTVAFAGLAMVGFLMPALRTPLLCLAAGCGLTRMFAGAHYATDVWTGALLGFAVSFALHRAAHGPRRGPGGGLVPG